MKRKRCFALVLISLMAAFTIQAVGQSGPQTGTFPFGSFTGGPDVIDLANLNVLWTIVVRSKPGRGTNFYYPLTYNSSVWMAVTSGSTTSWQPVPGDGTVTGWQGLYTKGITYIGYSVTYSQGNCWNNGPATYQQWNYSNIFYYDESGTRYNTGMSGAYFSSPGGSCPASGPAPAAPWSGSAGPGRITYFTPSGSNASAYILDANGKQINPPVVASGSIGSINVTDVWGNKNTSNNGSYTDTLNTNVLNVIGTAPSNTNLSYTAPSGGTATYAVSYKYYTVATNFAVSGIGEYGGTSTYLVDRVTQPDGSYYAFSYEPTPSTPSSGACTPRSGTYSTNCVTARIASVTLPTGGTVNYTYSGGDGTNSSGIFNDGSTATLQRQTPDGTWTYARTRNGSNWQTRITAPKLPYDSASNQTVIQFSGLYETQRQVYQGSVGGTPLVTTTTCYYLIGGNSCLSTGVSSNIGQRNVSTQYGTGAQSLNVYKYDANTNLTEHDVYDFPSGTTLLQKTLITVQYFGCNIVDKPASVVVQDGSGNTMSQTTYTYDQGTPAASSGTPQFGASPCQGTARGNLTTVTTTTHGSSTLTKTFTYYDTGMIKTATDVNGAVTTYNYPDATSTCGNAFATSVTLPVIGTTPTNTFSCNGAVATQTKDLNGNATNITFNDPNFWRPASVTDQMSNQTNISYSPTAVETTLQNFNAGNSAWDFRTTLDGLGRIAVSQQQQGPASSNYDSTLTGYDVVGRLHYNTLPYVGTAGQANTNAPSINNQYDALGRITWQGYAPGGAGGGSVSSSYTGNDVLMTMSTGQSKQYEYNGLGRLTSVCEISSSLSGVGTCTQSNQKTGYWTKYTYDALGDLLTVTQNAQSSPQQTRTFQYDMLGRMTSETNPETGSGAITNAYDVAPPNCGGWGGSTGDLTYTTLNSGKQVCFAYDVLHRITREATNTGGANLCKVFVYDSTTNGIQAKPSDYPSSGANSVGRLVEAETDSCATWPPTSASMITDEWFAYDKDGRQTDVWEKTPHSSGFYHTSVGYYPNGTISAINGLTGYTYTFGVDGEGRPNTLSDGSTTIINGVTYDAAGKVLSTPIGTLGDGDTYTYDSLERMKTYSVSANGQSMTGTLGWNPNGTVGSLSITDTFRSAGAQGCTFSYDDLSRIVDDNCGSNLWHQSYSYDPYGNLTKTGNPGISWNPGYNLSSNQMLGSSYDADGRALYDGVNTYTWDPYGKISTVVSGNTQANCTVSGGGICFTYDAFGRQAENENNLGEVIRIYGPMGLVADQDTPVSSAPLVAVFAIPGTLNRLYEYTYQGTKNVYMFHGDWLNTVKIMTQLLPSSGEYSEAGYSPYGDIYDNYNISHSLQFAGNLSMSFGGLSDTLAREYMNTAGRWLTPDPSGLGAVNPADPQTWNRYAYVGNNPLSRVDALGLDYCDIPANAYSAGGSVLPCPAGVPQAGCPPESSQCVSTGNGYVSTGSGIGLGGWMSGPNDPLQQAVARWDQVMAELFAELDAANNGPQAPPQNCVDTRALGAVPGAALTGTDAAVNGHMEVGISVSQSTLLADGFQYFSLFGANGYRLGNVFVSAHVNGIGGQLSPAVFQSSPTGIVDAQVHFDTFNPSTGLFGIFGHLFWDMGIGRLFFHHSSGLDRGC